MIIFFFRENPNFIQDRQSVFSELIGSQRQTEPDSNEEEDENVDVGLTGEDNIDTESDEGRGFFEEPSFANDAFDGPFTFPGRVDKSLNFKDC